MPIQPTTSKLVYFEMSQRFRRKTPRFRTPFFSDDNWAMKKRERGWLLYIGDDILSSDVGIKNKTM